MSLTFLNYGPTGSGRNSEFKKYMLSQRAIWYWLIIVSSITAYVSALFDTPPLVYVRWISRLSFLLFVPGFCLVKTLLPLSEVDTIDEIIYSTCVNLVLLPLAGLILNFSPIGLDYNILLIGLIVLSLIFASTAIIKDYWRFVSN